MAVTLIILLRINTYYCECWHSNRFILDTWKSRCRMRSQWSIIMGSRELTSAHWPNVYWLLRHCVSEIALIEPASSKSWSSTFMQNTCYDRVDQRNAPKICTAVGLSNPDSRQQFWNQWASVILGVKEKITSILDSSLQSAITETKWSSMQMRRTWSKLLMILTIFFI